MVSKASIPPHQIFKHGMREGWAHRTDIALTGGSVGDALRVFNGPVALLAMFLEVTEAVENVACNMKFEFDSDMGGQRLIADSVDIANAALGDLFYAECDGTAIVKATTGTGLITSGASYGEILTPGGIDITLDATPATGKGTLHVFYKPLLNDSVICAEDLE